MTTSILRNKAAHDFSRNPKIHLPRSVFKRPWRRTMSYNCSFLYPIMCKLVNPGETWKLDLTTFSRLQTQITAPMDNLKMQTFFFFDPCRLLWTNFPKMHGERDNPEDNISYIAPKIQLDKNTNLHGTIYDYLRAPLDVTKKIVAMPFRMYNHVYNSYFRNEQLDASLPFNTGDADDNINIYNIQRINKRADYITTGLPKPQAGEQVTIPLGTTAPVRGNGEPLGLINTGDRTTYWSYMAQNTVTGALEARAPEIVPDTFNAVGVSTNPIVTGLVAHLNEAAAASISSLRQMIATQELLERDNRNGTRYTEILEGRYGVTNPDLLLYRPQYLGGTTRYIGTTPVVQTSSTDTLSPQGHITGYMAGGDGGRVINASFGEWGYIMGLVCVTAEPQYQNNCDKMYTMDDRFDYYYPEFNYVGDEAITYGEVYCQGDDIVDQNGNIIDNLPFAYTERNAYYKQNLNEICGMVRSDSKDTQGNNNSLDYWTYAEKWTQAPNFNDNFIKDKTYETIKKTLAINGQTDSIMDNAQLIGEFDFDATVYSPMPEYNVPKISSMMF